MDNAAFRDLTSAKASSPLSDQNGSSTTFKKPTAAMGSLGSRARSFIPMTPRSIPGLKNRGDRSDFARQVAEVTRSSPTNGEPPLKKFKSSSAPKGTKLAAGYVDRTSLRRSEREDEDDLEHGKDDKAKRLKALEEMVKLQQIDQETFEKLRADMGVGGDVNSTHLVKGLDWKLLARIKRGEDINYTAADDTEQGEEMPEGVDLEAEFEKQLEKDIEARPKRKDEDEKTAEDLTGELATQQSLTRDEILRRLKHSRNNKSSAPASASSYDVPKVATPILNDKFKKVPTKPSGPTKEKFTETVDGRRREVLLITNLDGTTKRKTRWLDPELSQEETAVLEQEKQHQAEKPDKKKPKITDREQRNVMGMDVPAEIAAREAAKKAVERVAEEDDDDIFQGIGTDYNPLADVDSNSGSDSGSDTEDKQSPYREDGTAAAAQRVQYQKSSEETEVMTDLGAKGLKGDRHDAPSKKKSYFRAVATGEPTSTSGAKDPTILAALKRAADIRRNEEHREGADVRHTDDDRDDTSLVTAGRSDKSKAFLERLKERERQDAADMDMSFGGSRFADDDEDEDGDGEALHDFHDVEGEEESNEANRRGGTGKRKRGPKRRKGDKNDVRDIMNAMEGRKK